MLKKERSFTSCHLLNIICLPCSTSLSLSFSLTKISSLFVMQISGETGCQRNYTVSMFHSGRLTYAHHSPTNFETIALWIQSREYAVLRKVRLAARPHGTPAASGNQLERARNFSPGCNFCVPWHYARVFINRLVGKFAQTVLKPNVSTDGKYDDPTGAFLFYFIADDESREPLCARAKSLLPLFEFIDHSYSRDIGRLLENKRIDLGRVSTNFSIGTKETIEFWISYLWRKWILLCRKYKKYFVRYFNNLILIILFVIMIYKKSNILIVTIIFMCSKFQ